MKSSDVSAYIANQVITLSPFVTSGFYVRYAKKIAMLWIWDSEYELSLLDLFDLPQAQTDVLPESVLYPTNQSTCLNKCKLGGYELQIWRDDVLIGSRYWQYQPSEKQTSLFLKSFGVYDSLKMQVVENEAFSDLPWNEHAWSFLLKREFAETAIPHVLVSFLFLYLGWQITSFTILSVFHSYAANELESRQLEVGETLQNRQQAIALNEQNSELNSKISLTQLELITEFASKLTDNVTGIQSWKYQGNTLEAIILVKNETSVDIAKWVGNFEELDYVNSISVQRVGNVGNRWEVSAQVNL